MSDEGQTPDSVAGLDLSAPLIENRAYEPQLLEREFAANRLRREFVVDRLGSSRVTCRMGVIIPERGQNGWVNVIEYRTYETVLGQPARGSAALPSHGDLGVDGRVADPSN